MVGIVVDPLDHVIAASAVYNDEGAVNGDVVIEVIREKLAGSVAGKEVVFDVIDRVHQPITRLSDAIDAASAVHFELA